MPQDIKLISTWDFARKHDKSYLHDTNGVGHTLFPNGKVNYATNNNFCYLSLDGQSASLSTEGSVIKTDASFTVAAWVRLDSGVVKGSPILQDNEWARTALSQNSTTHSVFYLGVRRIGDTEDNSTVKWSFTIAPEDGRESGKFDWCRANSISVVDKSFLDKWVLLVGVLDTRKREAQLYIPSHNEISEVQIFPKDWEFWQTTEGLQVGKSRWLEEDLDHWPGSIGPIRVYSGVMTMEEAKALYTHDLNSLT